MLDCFQPGGGGYGDPYERDPAWVRDDVLDGYISSSAALGDYGVVLRLSSENGDVVVDEEATQRYRGAQL